MKRTALVALLAAAARIPSLPYTPMMTSGGAALHRADFAAVRFGLNSATAAGMRNADGNLTITPDSDPVNAIRRAMSAWNGVSTSAARFAPLEMTTALDGADGVNIIEFRDTPEIRSVVGSALAVTMVRFFSNGTIVESDIMFNPQVKLSGQPASFSTTLAPGTFDIQAVATHELGHALGASHSALLAATMFQSTGPATDLSSRLGADDIAFVTTTYPAAGSEAATGIISGQIGFTNGQPVRHASVVAMDAASGIAVGAVTSADGSYEIAMLPPGNYFVYAEPLDGPVVPESLSLEESEVDKAFHIEFFGGFASPQAVAVSPGSTGRADITVATGASPLSIELSATLAAGAGGRVMFRDGAFAIPSGGALDVLLSGKGLNGILSEQDLKLLGPGLALRAGSLHVVPGASVNGQPVLRFTVDAAPQSRVGLGSIILGTPGAASAWSAGLIVQPVKPQFPPNGVVNGGSFVGGGVAPGEIISIFGTGLGPPAGVQVPQFDSQTGFLPVSLADVKVTFDGTPAPLFYVSALQINVQVPVEASGKSSSVIVVEYGGAKSDPVTMPVLAVHPGLFGVVLNPNYAVNSPSAPAGRGQAVILWATGSGIPAPALATGQPAPLSPLSIASGVSVTIGGVPAQVLFAGMAPGFAGLVQINAVIPNGVATGSVAADVTMSGAQAAPVTIAVR